MNEAKNTARDILSDFNEMVDDDDKRDQDDFKKNLKPDINNLLHMYLPDDTTLKEMEVLAWVILDMIHNPDDYTKNQAKETE